MESIAIAEQQTSTSAYHFSQTSNTIRLNFLPDNITLADFRSPPTTCYTPPMKSHQSKNKFIAFS
ncbi:uncharacterized protein EAF02_001958 [Botrytis sinoallii]|uniref:uncharacterized protein n=1 Tax=Botrytis sinoallii TaxID=1463999 RepID=UPI001902327C|nr:uncharacterized protein EAF02_001958 [Botrytis sinoallii]KAF7889543.1 hypothetical protein EAF02_001958 [Botrytis sinoallii]